MRLGARLPPPADDFNYAGSACPAGPAESTGPAGLAGPAGTVGFADIGRALRACDSRSATRPPTIITS